MEKELDWPVEATAEQQQFLDELDEACILLNGYPQAKLLIHAHQFPPEVIQPYTALGRALTNDELFALRGAVSSYVCDRDTVEE